MELFRNPVARREWTWVRRHWLASILFLVLALAASYALSFVFLPWSFQQVTMTGRWILPFLSGGMVVLIGQVNIRSIAIIFLVLYGIERERRANGWVELASTRLSAGEILAGKLSIPISAGWILGATMQAVSAFFILRWLLGNPQASFPGAIIAYSASTMLGLIGALTYAMMASAVAFRIGWNRSFGHAFLVTFGLLVAIGLGITVLETVISGMATLVLSSMGAWGAGGSILANNTSRALLEIVVELWIAVRLFRSVESIMRSDLAGEPQSRLG